MSDVARQIELQLNEYQTDIHIVQIVLQHMIMVSIQSSPNRREILDAIQAFVRETLERLPNISDDQQDGERLKQLAIARSDRFFQPLNVLFGMPPVKTPTGGIN